MKWRRLGKLYNCIERHSKLLSHASNPLPVQLSGDIYRVYFSARDQYNRSSIGAVDIDLIKKQVVQEFARPIFEFGDETSFYSHGLSIGNVYQVAGTTYMLFMGWKIVEGQHWFGQIGRLIVNDDFSLSLDSATPFMGLDASDPISLSYPWVMKWQGRYKMWYGSTLEWDAGNGEMVHVLNYAESQDGHSWEKHGLAVDYEVGTAQAFSRPTVWVDSEHEWHMWYSFRSGNGTGYRIGYARSVDGVSFKRMDELAGIVPAQQGWDSEMVEYPFVFGNAGKQFMLYNGNSFGASGFGLAVLE